MMAEVIQVRLLVSACLPLHKYISNMKKLLIPLILLLSVLACDSYNTQEQVDKVLNVHDEVMPKIGEVMTLKKQLLDKAKDLTDSLQVNQLTNLAQSLENAHEGMMVWMREWSQNAQPHINEESDIEERKAFFEKEMEKVMRVKADINQSIAQAQEAIN